jgi:chromate reductase, NAD(P)H dehydrogenase (quinone)
MALRGETTFVREFADEIGLSRFAIAGNSMGGGIALCRRPAVDVRMGVGMRILAISGSLRAGSANLELLRHARAAAPADVEVVIFDGVARLPHFNPDFEANGSCPPAVLAWREAVECSDALLVASPEYGHSLPGALKNAIDWLIGSGQLERKIVAVTASVAGPERGRLGLAALLQALGAVSATIVGGDPIVRGETAAGETAALLRALVHEVRKGAARTEAPLAVLRPMP